MSLILCIACSHPWIYHETDGCEELIELDARDGTPTTGPLPRGLTLCACQHEGRCAGCVLDGPVPRSHDAACELEAPS
jgi:hypothetical protein